MHKVQEIYYQCEKFSSYSSFHLKKVNFATLFVLLNLPFSGLVVQSGLLLVMEITADYIFGSKNFKLICNKGPIINYNHFSKNAR